MVVGWLRQSLVPCALGHEALAHLLLVKQGRVHHVTEQMPKLSCFELRKERPVRRLSASERRGGVLALQLHGGQLPGGELAGRASGGLLLRRLRGEQYAGGPRPVGSVCHCGLYGGTARCAD